VRVRVTIIAVEKYYTLCVCVCSLSYLARMRRVIFSSLCLQRESSTKIPRYLPTYELRKLNSYIAKSESMPAETIKITTFLYVTWCSVINTYRRFGGNFTSVLKKRFSPWKWRQHVPLKHRYLSTRLHDVTYQKTVIGICTVLQK
jgi:hypothetical protein